MYNDIIFTIAATVGLVTLISVTSNSKKFLSNFLSPVFIVSASIVPIILAVEGIFAFIYLYNGQHLYAATMLFIGALTYFNISDKIFIQNVVVKENDPTYNDETIKITTVNVLYNNPDGAVQLCKELEDLDSDIILMIEYGPKVFEGLHPLTLKYRNVYLPENDNNDIPDVAIFSKYELYNTKTIWFEDRATLIAEINLYGTTVTVSAIHTMSPVNSKRTETWFEEFQQFTKIFSKIKTPIIIGGDFNASIGHRPYRDFVNNLQLRDSTLGVNTWSNKSWIPSWMHLDHILISKQWNKNADTIVSKGEGSDHKPVTVTISLAK